MQELIGLIHSVRDTPESEARRQEYLRQQRTGMTMADLGALASSALALNLSTVPTVATSASPVSDTEIYTAELLDARNATPRRQRPGSSLGINT